MLETDRGCGGSRTPDPGPRIRPAPGMDQFRRLSAAVRRELNLPAFDVDDVAQDAWIWIECEGARPRSARTTPSFEARIARHTGLKFLRDSRHRTRRERFVSRHEVDGDRGRFPDDDPPEARVWELLGLLKPEERDLLTAVALEKLTRTELARRTGKPRTTLESRLRQICARLRAALSSAEQTEARGLR